MSSGPALHLVTHYLSKTIIPTLVRLTRRPIFDAHIHDAKALSYFNERKGVPLKQIEPGPVGSKKWEDAWRQVEGEFDALARFLASDPSGNALKDGEVTRSSIGWVTHRLYVTVGSGSL